MEASYLSLLDLVFQVKQTTQLTSRNGLLIWSWTCKHVIFLMACRGRLHWLHKEVRLFVSLWENDSSSYLMYYLSKQFPYEFMVFSTAWCSFWVLWSRWEWNRWWAASASGGGHTEKPCPRVLSRIIRMSSLAPPSRPNKFTLAPSKKQDGNSGNAKCKSNNELVTWWDGFNCQQYNQSCVCLLR